MSGGVPAGTLSIEIIAEIARLQEDMRKVEQVVGGMAKGVGKSVGAANDNIAAIGRTTKLTSHQMLNLSYNLQDLGVQFAMAAQSSNPLQMAMMALFQQGSQIAGISQQAGVGIGSMAKQVAASVGSFLLAHPAILAVTAATAAGALAFKGFTDTLENRAPVEDYIKSLGLTADEAKKLTDTHVTLGDAAGAAWDMIKEALGLDSVFSTLKGWVADAAKWLYDQFKDATSSTYAAFAATYDNIGLIWRNLPALMGDAARLAVNQVIDTLGKLVNDAIRLLNLLGKGANAVFGTSFGDIAPIDVSRLKVQYSAAGKEVAAAWSNSFNSYKQRASGAFDAWEDRTIARRNARLRAQADEIIKDRKDKSSKAAKDSADEAVKLAKWVEDTRAEAQGNVWKLAQEIQKRQREWGKDQITLGDQMIQQANEKAKQAAAERDGQRELLDVYLQQLDAIGRMGSAFGPLAGILEGLETGNFSRVGGKIGGLLGLPTGGSTIDPTSGRVIAETLGDKLKEVFSKNGEFFQSLSSVLANAAIGSTAAGLAGGSKLGGGIGGAIGGFLTGKNGPFGKALESGLNSVFQGLGSFAGPLGTIAGGLLGGALGGLFKPKPKYGSAGLFMNEYGELAGTAGKGNAGSAIRAASGLASNVADGLNGLAEQLGAKITGVPNIAMGTYDGKYRVNVEGRGGKMDFKGNSAKGLYNFGDDEQAAIEFAIQKSIEGAVLTGISQASINILKSGQDLQKAIEKATLIEDIPKELQRRLDPVGYAIDELNKKWLKTVEALREGGATAQQMADAQKLYNLELIDAKESASSASQSLKDFIKAMNMGSSSPLSLRDQAASARSALDPFLAQISAGQSINQDKYLEAAQTYLDIERQMYGSTAKYFEAFDMIQSATNKAIAAVDNAAPIRTTADPFIEETATATKSMAASAENQAQLMAQQLPIIKDMAADMKALRQQIASSFTSQNAKFVSSR